jgi:hypothetical protein
MLADIDGDIARLHGSVRRDGYAGSCAGISEAANGGWVKP